MTKPKAEILDLMQFLDTSPTAWHVIANMSQKLQQAGFEFLNEGDSWHVKPGGRYAVVRNGSTICAFIVPTHTPEGAKVLGSHTDSPALKLKPNAEYQKENMTLFGVELYGAPLLTSWLNRDLGIAGRIVYTDQHSHRQEALVTLESHPLVIPQLAIHLDRNVNENGLTLNKQDHLAALAALDIKPSKKGGKIHYLETLIKEQINYRSILAYDLFLYPLEPAKLVGYKQQMIASYRLDSLCDGYAAFQAFLKATKPHKNQLKMVVFWDNEEIGSATAQGAASPFLPQTIERIGLALGLGREHYLRLIRQSFCISVDLSHALHPNYPDKHDPRHQSLMNRGFVLKSNAQQRYASDATTSATIVELCHRLHIPFQRYAVRSDIPSGSTIGPIHAHLTGMPTVDIGTAQLSMHSARELAACQDHIDLSRLLAEFLLH